MNILDAFVDIERLELKMLDLYQHFRGLFSDDGEAVEVFIKLRDEEKAHYDLVQYQRRMVSQNMKLFKDIAIDIEEVKTLTSDVDSIIKRIPPPSLSEAVRFAIDIESSATEVHYRTAMAQSNREVSDFLTHLGTADNGHFALLDGFVRSRGFLGV